MPQGQRHSQGIARRVKNWMRHALRGSPDSRTNWDRKWAREDFSPPWLDRGVSKQIVAAVEDGWFSPGAGAGARALDVGCGQGEVATWLAQKGFSTLGIDIAPAAIRRAEALSCGTAGLRFEVLDICAASPAGTFNVIVDRGCLHQIRPQLHSLYASNVAQACDAGARFLLFAKAFRNGIRFGDPTEHNRVLGYVSAALERTFSIDCVEETYLDAFDGQQPDRALPGMVFWMTRR